MYGWDVEKIFALAGGCPGLLDLCAATAPLVAAPTPATVAMWKSRGRISAVWIPTIVRALGAKGFHADMLIRALSPDVPVQAEDVGL